jgi:hypothetical protein
VEFVVKITPAAAVIPEFAVVIVVSVLVETTFALFVAVISHVIAKID